jgi:hypothetical protein
VFRATKTWIGFGIVVEDNDVDANVTTIGIDPFQFPDRILSCIGLFLDAEEVVFGSSSSFVIVSSSFEDSCRRRRRCCS